MAPFLRMLTFLGISLLGGLVSSNGQSAPKAERLLTEKSPFLQRHADNLVNWYPWGNEAFAQAAKLNRPVFMTIGYSTSPFCARIEQESFMNKEFADFLNAHFVCVLVDREERPAVDNACIRYLLLMKESPSWPVHIFMTPERRPLLGSSYLTNDSNERNDGQTLMAVLEHVLTNWRRDTGNRLEKQAKWDVEKMQNALEKAPSTRSIERDDLEPIVRQIISTSDVANGGSVSVPKFPLVPTLQWLHQYSIQFSEESTAKEAGKLVRTTLEKMAIGGIRDHIGGGFHRYALDERWSVPSFEKTLYDQALLAEIYSQAFAATGNPSFRDIANETFSYMTTRLAGSDGEFYSSEDSVSLENIDAEYPKPGAFYCWTQNDFDTALEKDPPAHALLKHCFNIRSRGNTPPGSDLDRALTGKNVLYRAKSLKESAMATGLPPTKATATYQRGIALLGKHRAMRPRPMIDRKVLVSWNSYAIASLARGSKNLQRPELLESAEAAMTFLTSNLIDMKRQSIRRSWLNGASQVEGTCDDYAALIDAFLALHEATGNTDWLAKAESFQLKQMQAFLDPSKGVFSEIPNHRVDLFLRLRPAFDADLLSANALSARNLVRLSKIADTTQQAKKWHSAAETLFQHFETTMYAKSSMTPGLVAAWEEFTRR